MHAALTELYSRHNQVLKAWQTKVAELELPAVGDNLFLAKLDPSFATCVLLKEYKMVLVCMYLTHEYRVSPAI